MICLAGEAHVAQHRRRPPDSRSAERASNTHTNEMAPLRLISLRNRSSPLNDPGFQTQWDRLRPLFPYTVVLLPSDIRSAAEHVANHTK